MKYLWIILLALSQVISCATQDSESKKNLAGSACNTLISDTSELPKYNFSELYPVYVPAPIYPRKAAIRRAEGYVVLLMDAEIDGTVTNVRIAEACPGGIFERSALKAGAKIRWSVRKKSGGQIRSPDVLYKFAFKGIYGKN